jgi:DNA-nicking Smr family endonuclease
VPHDEDEFAQAMADVVPLAVDPRGRLPRVPPPTRTTDRSDIPAPDGPPPDDYAAPGVDRREIRKLRRGEHTVRARLDLHGVTVVEASKLVARFIDNSRHARYRCVSIIHGKGLNSAGGIAVLRDRVRDELQRSPAVLAFAPAPPSRGGSGALYVLLRR